MRKIGLGITLGACLVAVLNLLTNKDTFTCSQLILVFGILLMLSRKS